MKTVFTVFLIFSCVALSSCKEKIAIDLDTQTPLYGIVDIGGDCTTSCPPDFYSKANIGEFEQREQPTYLTDLYKIKVREQKTWPRSAYYAKDKMGIIVHGETEDFYSVMVGDIRAFIPKSAVKAFYPYPEVLKNNFAYIDLKQTDIYSAPSNKGEVLPTNTSDAENMIVKVLDLQTHEKELWFKVNAVDCINQKVKLKGWVKAYNDNQQATIGLIQPLIGCD